MASTLALGGAVPLDIGHPPGCVVNRPPGKMASTVGVTIISDGVQASELDGVRVRSESEFIALYETRFGELAAQVYAYTSDASEAQDLVQEAFLRAWQRWDTVGGYDEPLAWIRRVAWNLATSRHRRVAVARRFLQRSSPPEPHPGMSPDHVALVAALRKLPEKQRRAVVLHYLGDLSVAEIAAQTGAKEGTVKSWLHRGRSELARYLNEFEATGELRRPGEVSRRG
ncbi:RNA polymerase sigma-70 factor (ECF subfamily) [Stackebrandtia albiflava]|uniref:RNA polymerase sigma factor n=1 Tax=Stackebrandtia albiflava TaxID=406432 RepID=A0A562UY48_9ACTN|nr:RNA polymerase sigma-70 factor (ECF subfamily) [Stackebrandtia albiflava]